MMDHATVLSLGSREPSEKAQHLACLGRSLVSILRWERRWFLVAGEVKEVIQLGGKGIVALYLARESGGLGRFRVCWLRQ